LSDGNYTPTGYATCGSTIKTNHWFAWAEFTHELVKFASSFLKDASITQKTMNIRRKTRYSEFVEEK
jgi:hypothetical protein